MNDDVSGWPSALLGEVYTELTGKTVTVEQEETTGIVPNIVGVDDRGRYVHVKFRVPRSTSRAEPNSAMVQRDELLAETHERDAITTEE
ncbi:hypothetical protein [Halorarum halobium]|uniref:hypothetical protein n=1 Tax=Halorarum halobium TaxID=3075121 RepID=UPI0028A6DE40|nr:hypothetical protein [Halobaculum sp. XH14]